MKKIIRALVIITVVVICLYVAWVIKNRQDEKTQQAGYTQALHAMKQTGHDEHSTDYMNPTTNAP
jgi:uncharacterized protein YpmB